MKDTWQQALDTAWGLAVEQLRVLRPEEVALRSGCPFRGDGFEVPFLGVTHWVSFPGGEVLEGDDRVTRVREVLVLHYLVQAKGTEPQGRWVDFRRLPGGGPYYPVFRGRVIYPLLKLFGSRPEGLLEAAGGMGRPLDFGDAAVAFRVFPRVEVAFGIWRGSEEFGPEGVVLFDPTVIDYLSTEDAIWACHEVLGRLKSSGHRRG